MVKQCEVDLEHEVRLRACKMSLQEINSHVNELLDEILVAPSPELKEEARVFANIYLRRKGK